MPRTEVSWLRAHAGTLVALTCALCTPLSALAQGTSGASDASRVAIGSGPARSATADYIRVVEAEGGERMKLETSARAFRRADGTGPEVLLVGVTHIGDKSYYDALQDFLDAQDVVLFEGVKPGGVGEEATAAKDDEAKRKLTEQRLRLLAILIERHRHKAGAYPASLDEMIDALPRPRARIARGAAVDAWGHAVALVHAENPVGPEGGPAPAFDLVSLAADGAAGGEGANADIHFRDQKRLSKAEIGSSNEGIQVQMAKALGLEFQLMAIDYDHPNWRNSDLSVDVVQRKLAESGQSGEALFKLLDGSSFMARLAGFALAMIQADKRSQATVKLAMVEMLGHADELVESGAGGMGAMMKVILLDRNQAVFDDLKRIVEEEKGVKSVALFYGGGHIPDLERRLTGELGYSFTSDRWFTAIDMAVRDTGLDPAQAAQMRQMFRQSFERQIKAAKGSRPTPGE